MRQFATIAWNAFMELVRQPIFLLLLTTTSAFGVILASIPYFGLGEDPKLVKDSVLAVMFMAGLFGAVLTASSSVAREIRTGTALAVLSKPVGRAQLILAKYAGLTAALTMLTFANLVSALLASRMAFDAYGSTDMFALKVYFGGIGLAYLAGGFTNYFLRRPFVSDAVFLTLGLMTISFVVINCFDKDGVSQTFAKGVDWRLIPASVLILFAVWILAGLATACSTRLETIPTLAVCSGVFMLGLMSDYLFGTAAKDGTGIVKYLAGTLYAIVPNWQLFWLSDAIEGEKAIPWSYVAKASVYLVGYLGASLAMALILFEDRELN